MNRKSVQRRARASQPARFSKSSAPKSPKARYPKAKVRRAGSQANIGGILWTTLAVALAGCLTVGGVFLWSQRQHSVGYVSFEGAWLKRYPYTSRYLVLLTDDRHFEPQTIDEILAILDRAYEYYLRVTGKAPISSQDNADLDLLPIAAVRETCGAGCGLLGANGIEIQPQYLDELYLMYQESGVLHHLIFYEFGRNFWNPELDRKLSYQEDHRERVVAEGFALFMQFEAMNAAEVTPAPFRGMPFEKYRAEIDRYLEIYLADPTLTWKNTLRVNHFPRIEDCGARQLCLSPGNLLAAFWLDLRDRFGPDFTQRFLWEVQRRPIASSTQDAVDNFIVAASAGADRDLSALFTNTWRWPLSPQARELLQERYAEASR